MFASWVINAIAPYWRIGISQFLATNRDPVRSLAVLALHRLRF